MAVLVAKALLRQKQMTLSLEAGINRWHILLAQITSTLSLSSHKIYLASVHVRLKKILASLFFHKGLKCPNYVSMLQQID